MKKSTGVTVSPEDIVGSFRHLLNEAALSEMDKIKISLPAKKQRTTPKRRLREITPEERIAIRERLIAGQEAARARRETEAKQSAKKAKKEVNRGASTKES